MQVVDEDLGGERGVDQTEAHAGGPADVHPHELIAVDGVEGGGWNASRGTGAG